MMEQDPQAVDRLIEEITRQVLGALTGKTGAAGQAQVSGSGAGEINRYIDHTLLKPDATQAQIAKLCQEASDNHFAAVCINPSYVKTCADLLRGSGVEVCTVIGFPLGATSTAAKAYEAQQAMADGATELDMVINVGALKSKDYALVERDIAAVVRTCHQGPRRAMCKVIIEAALLTDEEKVKACELSKAAGADYVKTSTGFGPGGATAPDVELMRRTVGPQMGVKAAGGVRTYADAMAMIKAGATRIGTSGGVKILLEAKSSNVAVSSECAGTCGSGQCACPMIRARV
jgi:deoxyribose-phosphate aldolase